MTEVITITAEEVRVIQKALRYFEEAVFERPTLRDMYAMSALQGLVAGNEGATGWASLALQSFSAADAMLKERSK